MGGAKKKNAWAKFAAPGGGLAWEFSFNPDGECFYSHGD